MRRSGANAHWAGSLKWSLDRRRDNLKAVEEEVRAVRRTAKDALHLQSEVRRLEKVLADAGGGSSSRTLGSLRRVVELRHSLRRCRVEIERLRDRHREVVSRLQMQIDRLRGSLPVIDVSWGDAKEYVDWLNRETGEEYRM